MSERGPDIKLTCNVPHFDLPKGHFLAKMWSKETLHWLVSHGIAEDTRVDVLNGDVPARLMKKGPNFPYGKEPKVEQKPAVPVTVVQVTWTKKPNCDRWEMREVSPGAPQPKVTGRVERIGIHYRGFNRGGESVGNRSNLDLAMASVEAAEQVVVANRAPGKASADRVKLEKIIFKAKHSGRIANGLVLCDNCDTPASRSLSLAMSWVPCAPCCWGDADSFDAADLIQV